MPDFVYLNAYAVTQHYGGPEEGGWWYFRGEPLAAVPIPAKFPERCGKDHCSKECEGECGEPVCDRDCTVCFADPVPDAEMLERETQRLKQLLAAEAWGKVTSVLGGKAVEIRWEAQMATRWPERTPHYE